MEDSAITVAAAIRALGGPTYAAQDLEWATVLPRGKALFEWLAKQVDCDSEPIRLCPDKDLLSHRISLHAIALHEEEVCVLSTTRDIETLRAGISDTPAEYPNIAMLNMRSRFMEAEADLLDAELQLLKHRLKNSKTAAKRLAQAIKAIQSEVERENQEIRQKDDRLGQLSVHVGTIISKSTRTTSRLLDATVGQPDLKSLQTSLAALLVLHTHISATAEQQFELVDQAAAVLPSPEEVVQEAARLHARLSIRRGGRQIGRANGRPESQGTSTDACCAELDKISELLESSSNSESRRRVLDSLLSEDPPTADMSSGSVDIKDEVTRAWSLDQLAILQARERAVDEATARLEMTLLPLLKALHEQLETRSAQVVETEALVSALIEELEDVADDVASIKAEEPPLTDGSAGAEPVGSAPISTAREPAHSLLAAELVDLLKSMEGMRPFDAGPLILLEYDDLVNELQAVRKRGQDAERAEREWTTSLAPELSTLSGSHTPLLSTLFANSPVNTSPPFGLSLHARGVEKETKEGVEHLNDLVRRFEKETQLSERDRRELTAFIDKWVR